MRVDRPACHEKTSNDVGIGGGPSAGGSETSGWPSHPGYLGPRVDLASFLSPIGQQPRRSLWVLPHYSYGLTARYSSLHASIVRVSLRIWTPKMISVLAWLRRWASSVFTDMFPSLPTNVGCHLSSSLSLHPGSRSVSFTVEPSAPGLATGRGCAESTSNVPLPHRYERWCPLSASLRALLLACQVGHGCAAPNRRSNMEISGSTAGSSGSMCSDVFSCKGTGYEGRPRGAGSHLSVQPLVGTHSVVTPAPAPDRAG